MSKLQFHCEIPYSAISIAQGEVPGGEDDTEKARELCRKLIQEYDALVASGKASQLHRVAHRIFAPGSRCRAELEDFCASTTSRLRQYSVAFRVIMQYALSPLVGRRVEEMHAKLKAHARKGTYHKPPAIAAGLREPDHLRRLEEDSEFRKFVLKKWRSRTLIDDVLRRVLPQSTLNGLKNMRKCFEFTNAPTTMSTAAWKPGAPSTITSLTTPGTCERCHHRHIRRSGKTRSCMSNRSSYQVHVALWPRASLKP
jgi:hypothetical protein